MSFFFFLGRKKNLLEILLSEKEDYLLQCLYDLHLHYNLDLSQFFANCFKISLEVGNRETFFREDNMYLYIITTYIKQRYKDEIVMPILDIIIKTTKKINMESTGDIKIINLTPKGLLNPHKFQYKSIQMVTQIINILIIKFKNKNFQIFIKLIRLEINKYYPGHDMEGVFTILFVRFIFPGLISEMSKLKKKKNYEIWWHNLFIVMNLLKYIFFNKKLDSQDTEVISSSDLEQEAKLDIDKIRTSMQIYNIRNSLSDDQKNFINSEFDKEKDIKVVEQGENTKVVKERENDKVVEQGENIKVSLERENDKIVEQNPELKSETPIDTILGMKLKNFDTMLKRPDRGALKLTEELRQQLETIPAENSDDGVIIKEGYILDKETSTEYSSDDSDTYSEYISGSGTSTKSPYFSIGKYSGGESSSDLKISHSPSTDKKITLKVETKSPIVSKKIKESESKSPVIKQKHSKESESKSPAISKKSKESESKSPSIKSKHSKEDKSPSIKSKHSKEEKSASIKSKHSKEDKSSIIPKKPEVRPVLESRKSGKIHVDKSKLRHSIKQIRFDIDDTPEQINSKITAENPKISEKSRSKSENDLRGEKKITRSPIQLIHKKISKDERRSSSDSIIRKKSKFKTGEKKLSSKDKKVIYNLEENPPIITASVTARFSPNSSKSSSVKKDDTKSIPSPTITNKSTIINKSTPKSSPVINHKISESSSVINHKISESSPVINHKISESSPVINHKISESSPISKSPPIPIKTSTIPPKFNALEKIFQEEGSSSEKYNSSLDEDYFENPMVSSTLYCNISDTYRKQDLESKIRNIINKSYKRITNVEYISSVLSNYVTFNINLSTLEVDQDKLFYHRETKNPDFLIKKLVSHIYVKLIKYYNIFFPNDLRLHTIITNDNYYFKHYRFLSVNIPDKILYLEQFVKKHTYLTTLETLFFNSNYKQVDVEDKDIILGICSKLVTTSTKTVIEIKTRDYMILLLGICNHLSNDKLWIDTKRIIISIINRFFRHVMLNEKTNEFFYLYLYYKLWCYSITLHKKDKNLIRKLIVKIHDSNTDSELLAELPKIRTNNFNADLLNKYYSKTDLDQIRKILKLD